MAERPYPRYVDHTIDEIAAYIVVNQYTMTVAEASPVHPNDLAPSKYPGLQALTTVPNLYWFTRLKVPPLLWGKGWGTKTLLRFLALADDTNRPVLCIPSSSNKDFDNAALWQFYLRHGFKDIDGVALLYSPKVKA